MDHTLSQNRLCLIIVVLDVSTRLAFDQEADKSLPTIVKILIDVYPAWGYLFIRIMHPWSILSTDSIELPSYF